MKSETRFTRQLPLLTKEQLSELHATMVTAGVAYELQGDWRQVFKRMSYKYCAGYVHRVYAMLATMHPSKIERLTQAISEVQI
jgi:hypothetical protein